MKENRTLFLGILGLSFFVLAPLAQAAGATKSDVSRLERQVNALQRQVNSLHQQVNMLLGAIQVTSSKVRINKKLDVRGDLVVADKIKGKRLETLLDTKVGSELTVGITAKVRGKDVAVKGSSVSGFIAVPAVGSLPLMNGIIR